jgi:hypothetical protein
MRWIPREVKCLGINCMNNKQGTCTLLTEPIRDKACPFYKTKLENDQECARLGVLTWQQMERLIKKHEF